MFSIPIFWVISTALVLQGVTIAARGPIKKSVRTDLFSICASPKSQFNFEIFSALISVCVCTAKTVVDWFPKK